MGWVWSPEECASLPCLPERVAVCSAVCCSAGAPSVLSRSIATRSDVSSAANATGFSRHSQSGMTSKPSTATSGEAESTSSVVGSPAKTSLRPVAVQGSLALGQASGVVSSESSKRHSPSGRLSRTAHTFELAALSPSSKTLPAWGIQRHGVCSALTPWVPRTVVDECGLLPTPTTIGNELAPSMAKWPVHARLRAMFSQLPTARASDAERGGRGDLLQAWRGNSNKHFTLPTPTAQLYGSNQGGAAGRSGVVRPSLERLTGGPWISFREWMMGWPIGWTACEPLATARFLEWLRWHSRIWRVD